MSPQNGFTIIWYSMLILYLILLIILAFFAKKKNIIKSLKEYYLAGGTVGSLAMFFTLYATQYSGNTLSALASAAYQSGFLPMAIVFGFMGLTLVYFLFAEKLNILSKQKSYITPGDFILDRFSNKTLLTLINIIMLICLINYGLANLKVAGIVIESISNNYLSISSGVIIIAIIIGLYEYFGGMRGVILTDILQGILLLMGATLVLGIVIHNQKVNHVDIFGCLFNAGSETFSNHTNILSFITLFITVSFGAAMYPQALQRIYAARDYKVLKKAYKFMLIMPIFTALPIILIGILSKNIFPDLTPSETDKIVLYSILHVTNSQLVINIILALYLVAVLAAIMSTIDSVLLTLGSIFINDYSNKDTSDYIKYRRAKCFSWIITLIMAILAIYLPSTIWNLMIFKLEFLIQLAPAFILGIRNPNITAKPVIAGIIAGIIAVLTIHIFIGLNILTKQCFYGIDIGVISAVINLITLYIYNCSFNHNSKK